MRTATCNAHAYFFVKRRRVDGSCEKKIYCYHCHITPIAPVAVIVPIAHIVPIAPIAIIAPIAPIAHVCRYTRSVRYADFIHGRAVASGVSANNAHGSTRYICASLS